MAIELQLPGGWFDFPTAFFAAGAPIWEDYLVALNSMARWAVTVDEYLLGSGLVGSISGLVLGLGDGINFGVNTTVGAALYNNNPLDVLSVGIEPGTLTIRAGSVVGIDDGEGHITGVGIAGGQVFYGFGGIFVNFTAAPALGVQITADFFRASDITGDFADGDTVPLPSSPDDGYDYERGETLYAYAQNETRNPQTLAQPAAGTLYQTYCDVAEDTGECSSVVNMFDLSSGDFAPSREGSLVAMCVTRRGSGAAGLMPTDSGQGTQGDPKSLGVAVEVTQVQGMALATPPAFSDVPDASFAVDEPDYASIFEQLAANVKYGSVRREVFCGAYYDGLTVLPPTSPLDGYVYSYPEITFWWARKLSYNPMSSPPANSGAGTIEGFLDNVSSLGVVSTATQYSTGGSTPDGELMVWMFCQRGAPSLTLGAIPAWKDIDDSEFAGGQTTQAARLAQLNSNIRCGIVRKEFFVATCFTGDTVPLPTSPVDGYQYKRSELAYLPSMVRAVGRAGFATASGQILYMDYGVDAQTGIVSSQVAYYVSGGAETVTTDGEILVLCVGCRNFLPAVRLSQLMVEALVRTPPRVMLSQVTREALVQATSDVHLSQLIVEALVQ